MIGGGTIPSRPSESGCVPSTSITGGPVDDNSEGVSANHPADDDDAEDGSPCDSCVDDTLSARSSCPRSGMGMGVEETSECRRSLSLRSSTAARISAKLDFTFCDAERGLESRPSCASSEDVAPESRSFFKPPQFTVHLRIVSLAVLLRACRSPARDFRVESSEGWPDELGDFVDRASEWVLVLLSGSGLGVLKLSSDGAGDGERDEEREPRPGEGERLVRRRPRNRFLLFSLLLEAL